MFQSDLRPLAALVVAVCALSACAPTAPSGPTTTTTTTTTPAVPVRAAQIAAGGFHTCAALVTGSVSCWGRNGDGQLGRPSGSADAVPASVPGVSRAIAVTAGLAHSCALISGGTVQCWGRNDHGQLGDATTGSRSAAVAVAGLRGVTAVSAGGSVTGALRADASVVCWGENAAGQLGDGTSIDRYSPVVAALPYGISGISAGSQHTCAVTPASFDTLPSPTAGRAYCWGDNRGFQLGSTGVASSPGPLIVGGLADVVSVDAGSRHTCAVTQSFSDFLGKLYCWGDDAAGLLGQTAADLGLTATPLFVRSAVAGVAGAMSAGARHTCAVSVTAALGLGPVDCWGANEAGQLGRAASTSGGPDAVGGLAPATAVAVGDSHSCALTTDGSVFCWGSNYFGALGNTAGVGALSANPVPTVVGLNA